MDKKFDPANVNREGQKKSKHTLKKPHTHGDCEYEAGEEIELWPDQVERLKANEII